MVGPSGGVAIRALARVRADGLRPGAEGGQRGHATRLVVPEASGLQSRAPLGDLTPPDIVTIARGVSHGIRDQSGSIQPGCIFRRCRVIGGVGFADNTPGLVRLHRADVAAPVRGLRAYTRARISTRPIPPLPRPWAA